MNRARRLFFALTLLITGVSPAALSQTAPIVINRDSLVDVVDAFYNIYKASDGISASWAGSVTNCNSGSMNQALIKATLLRLNYYRAMAGLNADIYWDPTLSKQCQDAALIMGVNRILQHDVNSSHQCYTEAGRLGALRSVLLLNSVGPDAVDVFMDDPGFSNTSVGHRRWLLYPPQLKMGLGMIPATAAGNAAATAIDVVTADGTLRVPVAWPPAGYVPTTIAFYRWSYSHRGATWSNAKIFVTRDGVEKQYAPISTRNGYGDNTIVWAPDSVFPAPPISEVSVRLEDIQADGRRKTVMYDVTLISPGTVEIPTGNEPAPEQYSFSFSMDAASMTPPVNSPATACGKVWVDVPSRSVDFSIYHGVQAGTTLEIGRGAPGINGPIVYSETISGSPAELALTLSENDFADLEAGNLYAVLRSSYFPGGAIRGQLTALPLSTVCTVVFESISSPPPTGGGGTGGGGTGGGGTGGGTGGYEKVVLFDAELPFIATRGAATSQNVYGGAASFEGIPTQWHRPSVYFNNLPSFRIDVSGYEAIQFYARCDQPGKPIHFKITGGSVSSNEVNILPYIDGNVLDNTWRRVRIPLSVLKSAEFSLDRIEYMQFGVSESNSGHHIFIDDVWAVTGEPEGSGGGEPGGAEVVERLRIFDGELPFTANRGAATTASAYEGAASFEGIPTPWHKPTIYLTNLPTNRADVSTFDALQFYARCNQPGKHFKFSVTGGGLVSIEIDILPYIEGNMLDDGWRLVRIPIDVLRTPAFPLNRLDYLQFGVAQPTDGHRIYIDNVDAVTLGEPTDPGPENGEPAIQSEFLLFDGEAPFASSYGTATNLPVFEGNKSFEGTPTSWNKPTILLTGLPSHRADVSGYDEIWFYARSNQPGKTFQFSLSGWPAFSNAVSIDGKIAGGVLDDTWRLVRIPISALKNASYTLSNVEALYFGKAEPAPGHRIYIDYVRAIRLP